VLGKVDLGSATVAPRTWNENALVVVLEVGLEVVWIFG